MFVHRTLKHWNIRKGFYKFWIGLVNINEEDDKNHENSWYWIDSKKAIKQETNWNNGEPSNSGNNEDCAEVKNEMFKFNDVNCLHERIAFCEID